MKFFETRYGEGRGMEEVRLETYQESLWAKAFGVETLEGLFDLTPGDQAVTRIDEAIYRFNHDPEPLRTLLDPADTRGLRGNRMVLEQMRSTLVSHSDATISGLVNDVPPAP
ncbi:hypothetical protein ACFXG4_23330 [Nocardia sp. NPDC059246]|uniref:hypothetical protein n=1 Tax=unclassified Nocardia TaxID=2637762 RepID=UPI003677668C